jgi:Asp-tRNA(Asn)/Glu-tRNA(Gln) amidotransferase A subunit family amidase
MDSYDAVLTPSALGEAPSGLAYTGDPACDILWTALHAPAITIPAGSGKSGLPLGLQIVAKAGNDATALAVARWLQSEIS